MSEFLFAYGTLQPGRAPEEIASVVAKLELVGEGSAAGVLYDLGEYPGALLDPSSEKRIFGSVFRLPSDPDLLGALDAYEGYDPDAPNTSLFVRRCCMVALTDERELPCWLYEYNREPGSARVLATGRFEG